MRHSIVVLLIASIAGCATGTSGHQRFYEAHENAKTHPHLQYLQPGETPTIRYSDDLHQDSLALISKGFWSVGGSAFNGPLDGDEQIAAQARRVGATVVLVSSAYTDTETKTVPLLLPNNSTTYGSGSVYGSGGGSAAYYGSSTTRGTTVVPVTSQHRRFDQEAVYYVKTTKKPTFGFLVGDLTPELRASIQRNTGVVIAVVMENSAAFDANILSGDILIKIDGANVRNMQHTLELMGDAEPPGGRSRLTILRNGQEKIFTVKLGANY